MRRRKWVCLGLAALALFSALTFRLWPRPLRGVLNETFWNETTNCTVSDFDRDWPEFETELVLGEELDGVWVRGPYEKKPAAQYGPDGACMELFVTWPYPDQPDSAYVLWLTVFREQPYGRADAERKYSFNVDGQCYEVVLGQEQVEAFIGKLYELAETAGQK